MPMSKMCPSSSGQLPLNLVLVAWVRLFAPRLLRPRFRRRLVFLQPPPQDVPGFDCVDFGASALMVASGWDVPFDVGFKSAFMLDNLISYAKSTYYAFFQKVAKNILTLCLLTG